MAPSCTTCRATGCVAAWAAAERLEDLTRPGPDPAGNYYFLGEAARATWAPSVANGVMVLGSGCVWAGARSLAGRRVRPWLLALPATAAFAVAFALRASGDTRIGSVVLLAMMGTAIGLASVALWRERARSWHLVRSLAVATAVCAVY
ncbi:hypothetical protein [Arthrobacter sp. UYCu712]|uniref:hypothetical protein n=1 Tax=Arthrobacter sp. UYCu712 TaxID=3156340 RepID=UPI00339B03BF